MKWKEKYYILLKAVEDPKLLSNLIDKRSVALIARLSM